MKNNSTKTNLNGIFERLGKHYPNIYLHDELYFDISALPTISIQGITKMFDIIKTKKLYGESVRKFYSYYLEQCILFFRDNDNNHEMYFILKKNIMEIFGFDGIRIGTNKYNVKNILNDNYDNLFFVIYFNSVEFKLEHFAYFEHEYIDKLFCKYYDTFTTEKAFEIVIGEYGVSPNFTNIFMKKELEHLTPEQKIILLKKHIAKGYLEDFKSMYSKISKSLDEKNRYEILHYIVVCDKQDLFNYFCTEIDGGYNVKQLESLLRSTDYYNEQIRKYIDVILEHKVIPNQECFRNLVDSKANTTNKKELTELLKFYGYSLTYDDIVLAISHDIKIDCNYEDIKDYDDGRLFKAYTKIKFYPEFYVKLKRTNDAFHDMFNTHLKLDDVRNFMKNGLVLDVKCLQNACGIRDNIGIVKFLLKQGVKPDKKCLKKLTMSTRDKTVLLILNAYTEESEVKSDENYTKLLPLPENFKETMIIQIPKNFKKFRNNCNKQLFTGKKCSFNVMKRKILNMLCSFNIINKDFIEIDIYNFILSGYIELEKNKNIVNVSNINKLIYTMIDYCNKNEINNDIKQYKLEEIPKGFYDTYYYKNAHIYINKNFTFMRNIEYLYQPIWIIRRDFFEYMKTNNLILNNMFKIPENIQKLLKIDVIDIPIYLLDEIIFTMIIRNDTDNKIKNNIKDIKIEVSDEEK
jgi:hypothetical protein